MITVVRSSGGVGSSLYSAGLNARLGRHNHQYFDARILTDGEKLRTVIPTMVGRCVYTAQEQPGGRDRIQDDLLKKVATAEGLMGRLPYTILAKLFYLVGWKRFETNKPLHLEPLEHAAFEALLRRFLVIALKARFYDRIYLQKNLPQHEQFGVFARDPTLKDFLESPQGIAASTSVQNQFEVSHGQAACVDIVNLYARNGGDKGATVKLLKISCNIPLAVVGRTNTVFEGKDMVDSDAEEEGEGMQALKTYSDYLVAECLKREWDHLTFSYFKQIPFTPDAPKMTREQIWEALLSHNLWKKNPSAKYRTKAGLQLYPNVKTTHGIDSLFSPEYDKETIERQALPESYDVANFLKHHGGMSQMNADILRKVAMQVVEVKKNESKRRGKVPQAIIDGIQGFEKRLHKLTAVHDAFVWCTNIVQARADEGAKREDAPPDDITFSQNVTYSSASTWPGRRGHSPKTSAAGMPQFLQTEFFPRTKDLDIQNAAFTLIDQMIDRLVLTVPHAFDQVLAVLKRLRHDRAGICLEELKVPISTGKPILLNVFHGQKYSTYVHGKEYLAKVSAAGRFWRWLSCCQMQTEYTRLKSTTEKDWVEGSLASRFWQVAEACVVDKWTEHVLSSKVEHVNNAFDGLRINDGRVHITGSSDVDTKAFCAECETHIKVTTDYSVTIVEKEHLELLELIRRSVEARAEDKDLKLDGLFSLRCYRIATGMLALPGGPTPQAVLEAVDREGESDVSSYRKAAVTLKIKLVPILMQCPLLCCGLWHLHCKDGVSCTNIAININKEDAIVHDGETAYSFSRATFMSLLESATDRWGFSWFLQAGGADIDPEETKGLSDALDPLLDLIVY